MIHNAKRDMDLRQLMLLESEVKNREKNMLIGYLLWWFVGLFGDHRFYMGRSGSAVAMLILSITGIGLLVTWIWCLVDAFLLHQWVTEHNQYVEYEVIRELERI